MNPTTSLRLRIAKIIAEFRYADEECSSAENIADQILACLPKQMSEEEVEKIFDNHTIIANNDILYRKGLAHALFNAGIAKPEPPTCTCKEPSVYPKTPNWCYVCGKPLPNAGLNVPDVKGYPKPQEFNPSSMDAVVWAKEFMRLYDKNMGKYGVGLGWVDKKLMIGWFANAIMAGYDEARRRYEPKPQPTEFYPGSTHPLPDKPQPICDCDIQPCLLHQPQELPEELELRKCCNDGDVYNLVRNMPIIEKKINEIIRHLKWGHK